MSDFIDIKVERNDIGTLLDEHRKKKMFTDVQLQVGDKLFDAHRNVLSLYSGVLKAAFSENWTHSQIYPLCEEHIDVEIMEDVLSFLYAGSIRLTPDNAQPICMAANFLQIPDLLDYSVNYLCQLITVENVLTLFRFSVSCCLEQLRYNCLLIIKGRESVLQSSQILEFSFKDFKDLIEGLKEAFADLVLRERSFHCIVRWTENNCSERLENLPILLKNIPLEELSPDFLTNTVSKHPLVKDSLLCAEMISTTVADLRMCPKAPPKQNFIVITANSDWRNFENTKTMELYDSRTGVWRRLPDRQFQYNCFAATVIDQQNIICSGGYLDGENKSVTDSVEMFNWNEQTWTKLPKMPIALIRPSMCTHNGHLYVTGDENPRVRSLPVLCYSFQTKQWKSVSSLNISADHLIATDDHLYAVDHLGRGEKYDPAQDQWTRMADQHDRSKFNRFAATLHQKKIYACGEAGFHVYDPATNIWTELPSPKNLHYKYYTSLVSLNGKLLVAGGQPTWSSKCQATDLIQEFDLSTQEWSEFGKLPSAESGHSTVVGNFY